MPWPSAKLEVHKINLYKSVVIIILKQNKNGIGMVNRQVVLETIEKMFKSGIEDSVVEKTLKGIGLSKKEIEDFIQEARQGAGKAVAQDQPLMMEAPMLHEKIVEKTAEKIKEHLFEQREEDELRDTTLHSAIEGHAEKISELHENVSGLHRKIDGFSEKLTDPALLKQLVGLSKKLGDFEQQLSDIKALSAANKTILEKILQANREMLNKL